MFRILLLLLIAATLQNCQTTSTTTEEDLFAESKAYIPYTPSDLQKLRWLAGAWKGEENGKTIRQLFQFHNNSSLEIMCFGEDGNLSSCVFSWRDGRFYYGDNRQWVVTWIGEKDIRFDPVGPNTDPMTWTRLNDSQWHLVRHAASGDRASLMERTEDMTP